MERRRGPFTTMGSDDVRYLVSGGDDGHRGLLSWPLRLMSGGRAIKGDGLPWRDYGEQTRTRWALASNDGGPVNEYG